MSTSPVVGSAGTDIATQVTGPATATGELLTSPVVRAYLGVIVNNFATLKSGAHHFAGDKTFDDDVDITGHCNVVGDALHTGDLQVNGTITSPSGGITKLVGRVVPRSARVPVPDAAGSKVLGVKAGTGIDYAGKRFELPAPAAPRVRVLKSTSPAVPLEGETIEIIYRDGAPGTGTQYTIKREDASVICDFVVESVGHPAGVNLWAEFEFVSGVWRLGASTGSQYSTTDAAAVGVVPGASA